MYEYEIRLVGQNPNSLIILRPDLFSTIQGYEIQELNYAIDPVRNRSEDVERFYDDLISGQGLNGVFTITDIRGKKFEFTVNRLQPID